MPSYMKCALYDTKQEIEKGNVPAYSHNICNGWEIYFSQVLNIHEVNDIRKTEKRISKPFGPCISFQEV
jgi:hypothetical protein